MLSIRLRTPGLIACLVPALLAYALGRAVPAASPLLVAIVLGVASAAVLPTGARTAPGEAYAARTLLRAGVVLLGLQLSLQQVADLGPGVIALIMLVVASGIGVTLAVGRMLGLSWTHRLLIGCGFSICGAAAVAAIDGVVDAEEEETASAVALVVVFGTAMIGIVPLVAGLLHLSPEVAGMWAGASVHEVAQVVAAGGVVGGSALAVAVVVKLGRVLLLAPVAAWVSWRRRTTGEGGTTQPPLVPVFVVGFLAMVLLRTWITPPDAVLETAAATQTVLLAAAMFALGRGVRIDRMRAAGAAPFVLAAVATGWVSALGLGGALLLG